MAPLNTELQHARSLSINVVNRHGQLQLFLMFMSAQGTRITDSSLVVTTNNTKPISYLLCTYTGLAGTDYWQRIKADRSNVYVYIDDSG